MCWLNLDYGQYISKLSVPNDDNSNNESDDLAEIDNDSCSNQGASDLVSNNEHKESDNNKFTEQEGNNRQSTTVPTDRLTWSKVMFENPVTTPVPLSEPPKQLSKELKCLYSNFATNVKGTSLITESLMMQINEVVETFLALIGGTDKSVDYDNVCYVEKYSGIKSD